MIRSVPLALAVTVALLPGSLLAQQPPTGFPEATRVESGTATNVVMAAYRTTMLADGEDEVLIRTFVTDSAGRQIMTADRVMRIYVDGDMTVDRPADPAYSIEAGTDGDGVDYWETRLVDGASAFILRAGNTVDRIQVEVRSGDLPPAGHEIHTIPADVELREPSPAQLDALRTRAIGDLPRMIGADISFLPQMEANGAIFTDGGEERDAVRILADNGFNFIRLRIFVNPENPEGYSPEQGFAGLEHTKEMARRIDAAGMGFLLDFHYSDYWADPQQQNKPLAWRNLDFVGLKAAMRRYTTHVIRELADQGTPPDMIQVGNEINHGLLWPDGHVQNLDNLAELLQAGIRGVRDAAPEIPVMLHIALGGQNEESRFWLDNMIARDVQFDLIGLSYYPRWHASLDDLKANLQDLVDRYGLPVNVVEYSPFKTQVHEIVFGLPDGMGNGTAIWEPLRSFFDEQTRAPTPDLRLYNRLRDRYLGSS